MLWSRTHTAFPGSDPTSPTTGCVTLAQPLNLSEFELLFLYWEYSKTYPVQINERVSR